MKTARQVKDLIRNLSRETGIDPQILIRQYMMEHLLERISLSRYNECFILKGGMLISALVGIALRSTLDMDATIKGFSLEQSTLMEMANEIIGIKMDDGIRYEINSIDNIHQDSEYNGNRLSLTAFLDEARIPLKMDITTGDRITPKEINYSYPMLLEKRSIGIFSYNPETVLAEKLETILSRSIANTRMRDYYDVYVLTEMKWNIIDPDTFRFAFAETCKYRGSQSVLNECDQIFAKILASADLEHSWQGYQQKYEFAREISFDMVCSSLGKLLNVMELRK
ncbi:MAG: nucleotidyl transferase AbiEii/AbiGii toxin family protein [Oscillospiraceae bacterium]|nr:nucleotidyl transferase AbiEii/AbiGii toxin family protein [Oscillospiraceae bacterium]